MSNKSYINKNSNKAAIISYSLIFAVFLIFLTRCFYGFDWSDETYYSAISYRLCMGDELFKENWDIHQLSAIITMPLVYIYTSIVKSTDGLILFMRITYTICQFLVVGYIYNCCKKRYRNSVSLLIFGFLLFIPFAIRSFSYNTLSLLFIELSLFLIFDAENSEKKYCKYFFSGVTIALAILAYPFLIVAFPIIFAYLLIRFFKKKNINVRSILLYISGGICVIAVFLTYLLINSSLANIVKYAKYLFLDPEHLSNTEKTSNITNVVTGMIAYPIIISFIALVILTIIYVFLAKKKPEKSDKMKLFLILSIIGVSILAFVMLFVLKASLNLYAIPLTIMAPLLYIVSDRKSDFSILIYFVGLAFAFSVQISSNNGINASSYPMILTTIATVMYLFGITIPSLPDKTNTVIVKSASYVMVIPLICLMTFTNISTVYRDASLKNLTCQIKIGSAKGLVTTEDSAKKYTEITEVIEEYAPKNGVAFFSKLLPFGYLANELEPAAPRLWRTKTDYPLFYNYYEINPQKLPDFIFMVNENYGVSNEENEMNGFIKEYIDNSNCLVIEKKCGTIYLINQ